MENQIFLTPEQAQKCLFKSETIHVFSNPNGMLLGMDHKRSYILEMFNEADKIEIGGETCRKMGHGIVIHKQNGDLLFVQCDDAKLREIENSIIE